MKTEHGWMMIALAATLALAMTFPLQRVARADDTGKIIAAIAAGVILYEILDDDDHGRVCDRPPRGKARGYYDNRPGYGRYRGYGGWRPAPVINGRPGPYYYGPQRPGTHVDVRIGPHGQTSVGFGYRDYRPW